MYVEYIIMNVHTRVIVSDDCWFFKLLVAVVKLTNNLWACVNTKYCCIFLSYSCVLFSSRVWVENKAEPEPHMYIHVQYRRVIF